MGRRGPAPKPTALKLVAGNPGKRPLNTMEPVPPPGEPDPPDFLDDAARAIWVGLVPRLCKIGLARSIDGLVLGRYCVTFVLWRQAVEFCRQNGTVFPVRADPVKEGEPGRVLYLREYPQAAEIRKLNQQLLLLEREFGLTPASRTRIQIAAEGATRGDVNDLKRRFFGAAG